VVELGDEYPSLLSRIETRFLSAAGLVILAEHFVFPPEWVCCSILDSLLHPASAIVADFPELFEDFKKKRFALRWRGGRDGFAARDSHRRCGGYANTLTLFLDTDGNSFTRVEWDSYDRRKPTRV
jgi:hypothetical protein